MKNTKILLNKKLLEPTKIKPIRLSKNKKLIVTELLSKNISAKQLNILMNKPLSKNNPVSFIKYLKGTLLIKSIIYIFNKIKVLLSNKWITLFLNKILKIPFMSLILIRVIYYLFGGLTTILLSFNGIDGGMESLHYILTLINNYFNNVIIRLKELFQVIEEEDFEDPKIPSDCYLEPFDKYIIPESDLKNSEGEKTYAGYIFLLFIMLIFGILIVDTALKESDDYPNLSTLLRNKMEDIKQSIYSWIENLKNEDNKFNFLDTGDSQEEETEFDSSLKELKSTEIYKNIRNDISFVFKNYNHLFNEEEYNTIINSINNKEKSHNFSLKMLNNQYFNLLNQYQIIKTKHFNERKNIEDFYFKDSLTNSEKDRLNQVLEFHDSILTKDLYKIDRLLTKLDDFLKKFT